MCTLNFVLNITVELIVDASQQAIVGSIYIGVEPEFLALKICIFLSNFAVLLGNFKIRAIIRPLKVKLEKQQT